MSFIFGHCWREMRLSLTSCGRRVWLAAVSHWLSKFARGGHIHTFELIQPLHFEFQRWIKSEPLSAGYSFKLSKTCPFVCEGRTANPNTALKFFPCCYHTSWNPQLHPGHLTQLKLLWSTEFCNTRADPHPRNWCASVERMLSGSLSVLELVPCTSQMNLTCASQKLAGITGYKVVWFSGSDAFVVE